MKTVEFFQKPAVPFILPALKKHVVVMDMTSHCSLEACVDREVAGSCCNSLTTCFNPHVVFAVKIDTFPCQIANISICCNLVDNYPD